jgi:hypothetical protein
MGRSGDEIRSLIVFVFRLLCYDGRERGARESGGVLFILFLEFKVGCFIDRHHTS